MAVLVWVRNRSAAGSKDSGDPQLQVLHDDVGISHLEIVARREIDNDLAYLPLNTLAKMFPAPKVS